MKRNLFVYAAFVFAICLLALPSMATAQASKPSFLKPATLNAKAPDIYQVNVNTTQGTFVLEINRSWAPLGADRFYNLVVSGYFTDVAFFRAIDGFMVQFGIHGNPEVSKLWRPAKIKDDRVVQSNMTGYLTFATAGQHTRTTQMFINFSDNIRLDAMGFAPIGKVVKGMDIVNSLYTGYGEGAPRGRGPDQNRIQYEGNAYLKKSFPMLDYIKSMSLVKSKASKKR